jgi:hypothetical protein
MRNATMQSVTVIVEVVNSSELKSVLNNLAPVASKFKVWRLYRPKNRNRWDVSYFRIDRSKLIILEVGDAAEPEKLMLSLPYSTRFKVLKQVARHAAFNK